MQPVHCKWETTLLVISCLIRPSAGNVYEWFVSCNVLKEPVCMSHWWIPPLFSIRDLLLRDNLFEIITGSRTFYIQVRLRLSLAAASDIWLFTNRLSVKRRPSASCFVTRSPQVYPSWCYVPLSVNALLPMCDKDSPSDDKEFVLWKEKKKVHNHPWRSQQRFSCERASLRWENSCVWQQQPHQMGSCSKGACKHVQFIFVCSRKKKEALTNINQQENETKKTCSVQFECSVTVPFFASDRPAQRATFKRGIFRAIHKIQSFSPDKKKKFWFTAITWCDKGLVHWTGLWHVCVCRCQICSLYLRAFPVALAIIHFQKSWWIFFFFFQGIWTLQVWLSSVLHFAVATFWVKGLKCNISFIDDFYLVKKWICCP